MDARTPGGVWISLDIPPISKTMDSSPAVRAPLTSSSIHKIPTTVKSIASDANAAITKLMGTLTLADKSQTLEIITKAIINIERAGYQVASPSIKLLRRDRSAVNIEIQVAVVHKSHYGAGDIGHGDFCFDRIVECAKDDRSKIKSQNYLAPELDFFTRDKPFPYLRLPLEIRQKIIRLLLGSFYRFDPGTKKSYIPLTVEVDNISDSTVRYHSQDYETYLSTCVVSEDGNIDCVTREEWNRQQHIAKIHPNRRGRYKLKAHPSVFHPSSAEWSLGRIDFGMIQLVRDLSNISTQFRKELGNVFWTRVHLVSLGRPSNSALAMQHFVWERPAICQGLKSLCLNIRAENYYGEAQFARSIEFMAQHLVLEELYICLSARTAFLEHVSARKTYHWLHSFKALKVTEYFELDLSVSRYNDEERPIDHAFKLKEVYTPAVIRLIIPNTFRAPAFVGKRTYSEVYDYVRTVVSSNGVGRWKSAL